MGVPIFEAIASEERLHEAWKRVRRNKGIAGVDRVSIQAFAAGATASLADLRRRLRSGRYRPERLLKARMAKASGGVREIGIPCVMDRVAQASAALALDGLFEPLMSDASFAYRRNRSVEHAVGRVLTYRLWGFEWLVDGDIADFFGAISHGILRRQLNETVKCARTLALIDLWLGVFSRSGVGIAQGSPLSPLLANVYLTPIDHAIHTRRARLVRYSDDFVLMARTQSSAVFAMRRMEGLLAERGLALKPEKTSVKRFQDGVEFLGYRFVADGRKVERAEADGR